MKKFLLGLLIVMCVAGVAFAAVEVQNDGTSVGKSEHLNFVGPDTTRSGGVVTVDVQTLSGDIYESGGDLTVDEGIYVTKPYGAIWFRSSTGNPVRCGVDAAGTTWACAVKAFPAGK